MTFSESYFENNRKKRKNQEEEQLLERDRNDKFKEMEKRIKLSDIKLDLEKLKVLIEEWLIDPNVLQSIDKWLELDEKSIQQIISGIDIHEIFDKIEEIEDVKWIDDILPKHLRVNKQEYLMAFDSNEQRINLLIKIDDALTHLYMNSTRAASWHIRLFTSFMHLLDRKLIFVQENMISIKRSLL